MNRYISLVTICSVALFAATSCGKKETTKRSEFAIQGCAVGGLTTGLVAYAKNRDDDDAMKKSAITSMLGCMAGGVVGYQVGKRTEEYTDAQSAAISEIARNEAQTDELQQFNAQLEQNILDYKKQIGTIKDSNISEEDKMNNLQNTKEIVAKQRRKATNSLKSIVLDIIETKDQYSFYQQEATPQEKNKWQAEIAVYEQEKGILSKHVNTLNALDASI